MSDFTYVYRLRSQSHPGEVYTGHADNLEARLVKHNSGCCSHTAKFRPWTIEMAIAFRDQKKAITFEQYLKTGSGREFARRHF